RKTWQFVRDNWDRIEARLPAVGVRRMCEGVTGLATPAWEQEVREFFTGRKIDLGGKTLEQYLEQLRVAVRLRQREAAALSAYLRGVHPAGPRETADTAAGRGDQQPGK